MTTEAIFAVVVFAGMFVAWAVLPSFLRRRHVAKAKEGEAGEA